MKVGILASLALSVVIQGCRAWQPEPAAVTVPVAVAPPLPAEPALREADRPTGILDVLALELKAPGAEVEMTCEKTGCPHPLATFFDALERNTPASAAPEPVRAVALGNSLIVTDAVVSVEGKTTGPRREGYDDEA